MTPYQLNLHIHEYNKRKAAEEEEKLTIAYLGAYWNRVKRMPSLKEILGKNPENKQMTPEEMLAEVKKLNASMGGTTY